MKCDEAFRPLLLSKILRDTMDEIAEHKKDRDDAQKSRIETAMKVLATKEVALCAYPAKTIKGLKEQMDKQMAKINKKKDKK